MKPYVKTYFKAFGYDESSFIPCEVCGAKAVDIHHIEARGMGGDKTKDVVNNLMAMCRRCHEGLGDKKDFMESLNIIHRKFMLKHLI